MLKRIWSLFKDKRIRISIAILITISIAILCLIKIGKQPISVKNIDKLEHTIAYLFLTLSWLFAFGKNKVRSYIISISCVLYGIIIEVLQSELTTYRSGDYYDVLANVVGVFLAFAVFMSFFYKKGTN